MDERAELDGPAEVADDIDADEACAGSSSSAENAEQLIGRASVEYSGTFGRNRRTAWDQRLSVWPIAGTIARKAVEGMPLHTARIHVP